ncbi:MAG: DNA/RNA non-specific endonuclease [Blastocatellia bacterium]
MAMKKNSTTTPARVAAKSAPQTAGAGYDPDFLGTRVEPPKLSTALRADTVRLNGSEVINYTHFSLTQSKSRRFAFWVAWNIDGGRIRRLSRVDIPFVTDPRVPKEFQSGDELYSGNDLDRGHIARRADLLWGNKDEASRANRDSFFFTNITPQMDDFNQGKMGGLWGGLEDAIFADVDVDNLRVSLFGGPIFHKNDPVIRGVQIPLKFFKVILYKVEGKLRAAGFVLLQELPGDLEALELPKFKVFQKSLADIEQSCGFSFSAAVRKADRFTPGARGDFESMIDNQPLQSLTDIRW